MCFAGWIVRAQWVLFLGAAGVLPNNAREISQMGTREPWARLACPHFHPLQCPPVLQRKRGEQYNEALQLFACSGHGGTMF